MRHQSAGRPACWPSAALPDPAAPLDRPGDLDPAVANAEQLVVQVERDLAVARDHADALADLETVLVLARVDGRVLDRKRPQLRLRVLDHQALWLRRAREEAERLDAAVEDAALGRRNAHDRADDPH